MFSLSSSVPPLGRRPWRPGSYGELWAGNDIYLVRYGLQSAEAQVLWKKLIDEVLELLQELWPEPALKFRSHESLHDIHEKGKKQFEKRWKLHICCEA